MAGFQTDARSTASATGLALATVALTLLLGLSLLPPTSATAATIVVDSVDDPAVPAVDGNCTLREAIASVGGAGADTCESGADPAVDTIVFDDLGPGDHLIDARGGFIINSQATIDASGLAGELRIDGDGAPGPQPDFGVLPRASGTILKGLTVTRWTQIGIKIDINNNGTAPADNVQVIDNFIGTDEGGTTGLGNGSTGIGVGLPSAAATDDPDFTDIEGNVISGNANGINVAGVLTEQTRIAGNRIGTNPTGDSALPNGGFGIQVSDGASQTVIGGPTVDDGNVVSGNGSSGISVSAVTADPISGTQIRNNLVGLGSDGSTAIGNGGIGVSLNGWIDNTLIAGNSIASNGGVGIQIVDGVAGGVDSTTITGNHIGVDRAGGSLRANSDAIMLLAPAGTGITNTKIGGATLLAGDCAQPCNVIAGGRVVVNSPTVTGTEILGNYIGVDVSGAVVLNDPVPHNRIELNYGDDTTVGSTLGPNLIGGGNNGVKVDGTYAGAAGIQANRIGVGAGAGPDVGVNNAGVLIQGADGVEVGGLGAGQGNLIANNGTGVQIDTGGTDNPILGNSIYDNGGLGIDLFDGSGGGVTINDVGDNDPGSNDLQNYPELEVVAGGQTTRVLGRFNSTNATLFRLEFYASSAADESGFGEGQRFLGFTALTGVGAQQVFDVMLPEATLPGEVVSATATRIDGGVPESTSEFSNALAVDSCGTNAQAVGAIVGTGGNDSLPGTAGDDVICGSFGNDTIAPGQGNDTVIGGPGFDFIDQSASSGPVEVDLALATSTGEGNDFLRGIEGAVGSGFADTIRGDGGRNVISGGRGADRILGGGGGNDLLRGQAGNDVIAGGTGYDRLYGGTGRDRLIGAGRNDRLWGQAGNDILVGGSGKDSLDGGSDNDRLIGGIRNDRLFGKAGRDVLLGGAGNDFLDGGAGWRDVLRGGGGRDVLSGGAGRKDLCDGGAGRRDGARRSCERRQRIP